MNPQSAVRNYITDLGSTSSSGSTDLFDWEIKVPDATPAVGTWKHGYCTVCQIELTPTLDNVTSGYCFKHEVR